MSFSSPTPAPGSRALASTALRNAGLIDRDATMRDVSDKPGGRKGSSKIRSHRNRPMDAITGKDQAGPSSRMLSTRSHASSSDPLAIRGASRPTQAGRIRRNALSLNGNTGLSGVSVRVSKTKPVEAWRQFVKSRWNPETRFLNLERMIDDDIVKKYNLTPPGHGGGPRDAAVIYKLAAELTPEVQTLSLAHNNLNGVQLTYLSKYLPRLANLSLEGNNIRQWKDLEFISARQNKMVHLRELILTGNPIRELEYKHGRGESYKQEMSRRLTSLEVLDQEAITQISFDVPQPSTSAGVVQKPNATSFPYEMGPSFITGVDGALVSNFLIRFFNAFDSTRQALLSVYAPNATFSFSANTSIPARARISGYQHHLPNQKKLEWGIWLKGGDGGSRNLSRLAVGVEKGMKSLHIGGEAVMKAIGQLPATRHEIAGPPERFCVDAFPVVCGTGMGLMVIVHGQFTEVGAEGIRSFDRTFILAPADEGTRARQDGWDVMILSDQWTIRSYSSHEAWTPGPMLVQAELKPKASKQTYDATKLSQDQQAVLAQLSEVQRNVVLKLIGRTNLNVKFAVDCLVPNGWDLEQAVKNFNEVKANLGKEAFL
ncbi:hypothetical protein BDQ12DRAFT_725837 [Crucibulum laeve]|uniref:NTF2-like protein n=1 Tax=Crucibulum laeve TaxID=68775 RepID=A0A5C3LSG6_9AGAR|nr:hypothetical protein BDQ12DRAFT_725837 [Crucibulum laeve]